MNEFDKIFLSYKKILNKFKMLNINIVCINVNYLKQGIKFIK